MFAKRALNLREGGRVLVFHLDDHFHQRNL
jgi:hypothetical protein